jgi:hypothetical protein
MGMQETVTKLEACKKYPIKRTFTVNSDRSNWLLFGWAGGFEKSERKIASPLVRCVKRGKSEVAGK